MMESTTSDGHSFHELMLHVALACEHFNNPSSANFEHYINSHRAGRAFIATVLNIADDMYSDVPGHQHMIHDFCTGVVQGIMDQMAMTDPEDYHSPEVHS